MGAMSESVIVLVIAVLCLMGFIKAVLGFGESLITMPLLTLLIGAQVASPLAALLVTVLTGVMLVQSWQKIDLRSSWRVMLAAVIGIPFGLWGLRELPAAWINLALGLALVLVGLYNLRRPALAWVPGLRWGYVFGFFSGVFGSALNIGGPPVVIYGTLRRLPPAEFRATLQGYFTPLNLFILLGHALAGLWTPEVLQLFGYALVPALAALWLGSRLHRAMPPGSFERVVYGVLLVLGTVMMGRALL